MRILFAGTPDIAVSSLRALAAKGQVVAVLSNPDEPVGRKRILTPPPVKAAALALGLPVYQPERLDTDAVALIRSAEAEILVCFAYGKIFPRPFLELFPRGGVNIHPSLLPLYRGPSPLTAAILAGDAKTGISLQTLAPRMDCGDILARVEIPLDGTETTPGLSSRVAELAPELLVQTLEALEKGSVRGEPQDDSRATYCTLVKKEDGLVDWSLPAEKIHRRFRAYQPWPGLHTLYEGVGLSLLECAPAPEIPPSGGPPGTVTGVDKGKGILIQTGQGLLGVTTLRLQARNAADFRSFLNGTPGFIGRRLGG